MPANTATEPITFSVNGLRLDGIVAGPMTGELVLFLHGFPEFADAWLNVLQPVAAAGFRAVAMNQCGYSPHARPPHMQNYTIKHLCNDVLGFVDTPGAERFHLVAHDSGGFLAWQIASEYPARLPSLSVVSTTHTNAFLDALKNDEDQKQRSKYIDFFRMSGGAAESYFIRPYAAYIKIKSLTNW